MMDEKIDCTLLQEKIAWSKELSSNEKLHSLNCLVCHEMLVQFEKVNSLISSETVTVPTDFASNVMKKISKFEKRKNIITIFDNPFWDSFLRFGVCGASFLIALAAH